MWRRRLGRGARGRFHQWPTKPAYIIYPQGLAVLPLIAEALALVAEPQRWQVTFNTYHTDLPAGLSCNWRCCAARSPAVADALRSGAIVIDLSARFNRSRDGPCVQIARMGVQALPTTAHGAGRPRCTGAV